MNSKSASLKAGSWAKILIIVAAVDFVALTAQADTIVFGSVGPSGTYQQFGSYGVENGIPGTPPQEIGARFVSPMNGSISQVELGLTYADNINGIALPPGTVNVFLYTDSNGSPNNASQVLVGSVSPTTVTGGPPGNLLSTAVSPSFPVSAGISYWLVLKPAAPQMWAEWRFADPNQSTALSVSRDDAAWTISEPANFPAFRFTASGSYPPITVSGNPPAVASFSDGSPNVGSGAAFSFSANTNLKLTDVGVWDEGGDGLNDPINIDVRASGGSVNISVGNATIPAGTRAPLLGGFRYVPLSTPILVASGTGLSISSFNTSDPVRINAAGVVSPSEVNIFGTWFGPNFLFSTDPVVNNNFENGQFEIIGFVSNWSAAGAMAVANEGATSGTHSAVFSAGNESEGNQISQRLFTTPNQRYILEFDAGVFGKRTGAPLQLNAKVLGTNTTVVNQTVTPPDAGTFDATQVVFQHYQFSFIADSTLSRIQFTDMGLGNAVADVVLDTVRCDAAPAGYAAWQRLYFTDEEQNDLLISGWAADPDVDGLPNGLEFYCNSNPIAGMSASEATALPRLAIQPSTTFTGSQDVTITHRRRIGAGGVVEGSFRLSDWSQFGVGVTPTGSPVPTGDGVTETAMHHSLATREFVRLKVKIPRPQVARQWRSSAGGNDHWYEIVTSPLLDWPAARDYAVDRGGYLATITSSQENDFIKSLVPAGPAPFIGGYKDSSGWRWVTGEPFAFTNWDAGEPNNFNGQEDRLQFLPSAGTWNDTSRTHLNAFIVEYPQ